MLKFKTMLGIVAIFGLMAVPMVFAAPLRKYVNQNANGDLLRTQDQDRLRERDCDCTCDCSMDRNQTRLRLHECAWVCNNEAEMEQHQYRNQNGQNSR